MKVLLASLPLFRIFGVPVQAHFTCLLYVAGFMAWIGYEERSLREVEVVGLIFVLVFGSLLVHEFAHVFAARRCGCRTSRILLLPIGCVAELEAMPRELNEIWVALAGPMASAALGIVSFLALRPLAHQVYLPFGHARSLARSIMTMLCFFNLLIASFNLIPCFPMDGGRILRSLLALLIKRASPRGAADAFFLASRISVRYVARPVATGFIVVTCLYTHIWMDVVLFTLIILAGEAELSLLRGARDISHPAASLPCAVGLPRGRAS
jgi:Zn-dependent protease